MHLTHVGRCTRHTKQAGLLVEQVGHSGSVQSFLLHDKGHGSGIDVATACAHHQAFERSQAHAGVHTFAILDGRYGTTVAHVAGDDARTFGLNAEKFAHTLGHIAVRGSMEAVTADAVLLIQLIGNGIHVGVIGHGLMESSVEHTHLRNVGQQSRNGSHTLQVGRIVERSQVVACRDGIERLLVEDYRLAEAFAAVHDAMAYRTQFLKRFQRAIFLARQRLKDELHAYGVFRYVFFQNDFLAIGQGQFQE